MADISLSFHAVYKPTSITGADTILQQNWGLEILGSAPRNSRDFSRRGRLNGEHMSLTIEVNGRLLGAFTCWLLVEDHLRGFFFITSFTHEILVGGC